MKRHILLGAILAVVLATPASADVSGDCIVHVGGQNVAPLDPANVHDAVRVDPDEPIQYQLLSDGALESWDLYVFYGPIKGHPLHQPIDKEDNGTKELSGSLDIDALTKYGVGVYHLRGKAAMEDGRTCTADLLIDIQGEPYTSALGVTALVFIGIAAVGSLLLAVQAALQSKAALASLREFQRSGD